MKFTREELWQIRFGLSIAQAWQDQKIENGESSCISKSYLCSTIAKIDDYLNYQNMGWIRNLKRLIRNKLNIQ